MLLMEEKYGIFPRAQYRCPILGGFKDKDTDAGEDLKARPAGTAKTAGTTVCHETAPGRKLELRAGKSRPGNSKRTTRQALQPPPIVRQRDGLAVALYSNSPITRGP